ncbi:MAG: carbohydrate ABC transporter permease [Aggregatilineaceae bacterium]
MIAAQNRFWSRVFLGPAALIVLAFSIFPLVYSLAMTFTNKRLARAETRFIGLENWTRLFDDERFLTTLQNTVVFVVCAILLQYLLGSFLAVLLNQRFRGRWFFRLSFLMPMMMSPVAVSFMIGRLILHEVRGPLAIYLMNHNVPELLGQLLMTDARGRLSWTTHSTRAMIVVILIDTWQWTPFFLLVMLAGLQNIPVEIEEAARVDGANAWQRFWRITFPMLLPLSSVAVLIRGLEAFKVIDIIRVATAGGPGNATESVTLYAYDMGVKNGEIAYATTMAYALLILMGITATLYIAITQRLTRWRRESS